MESVGSVIRVPWQLPSTPAVQSGRKPEFPAPPEDRVSVTCAAPETRPSSRRRAYAFVSGLISLCGALAAAPAYAQAVAAAPMSQSASGSKARTSETPQGGATTGGAIPQDTTRARATSSNDPRTTRTDAFLRQWTEGLFDMRVPLGERLDNTFSVPVDEPRRYPFIVGDPQAAPPLNTLGDVHSFDDLRRRVDGWYATRTPSVDQIAVDMGARYGRDNYATGSGGSIPADTNAFDLYNRQKGVCVEIHSAIAAYRAAHGQEAYLVGSSGVGNSHAFLIFKDNGRWFVQNYGKVIETDARNIRELFDRSLPEEVRPSLYRPAADGRLQLVERDFITGVGRADRRFTDRAGSGAFDPFLEDGRGATFRGSQFTLFGDRAHLSVDPARGDLSGGWLYRREGDASRQSVAGFAGRVQLHTGTFDAKWETESRWQSSDRFGRTRLSVFGGVETNGWSAQYWNDRPSTQTGRVGASIQHNESFLHGDGSLKIETGYDMNARAVWTYGLNEATRGAFTGSQNGGSSRYLGDVTRMLGDASASAGASAGAWYSPDSHLLLRTGLRMGANASSLYSIRPTTALQNAFQPGAYVEGQWRPGLGVIAGGALQVPLNEGGSYRLATVVGWSPSQRFTLGLGYSRQAFLLESWDRVRAGVQWSPRENLEVQAGVDMPGLAPDASRGVRGEGGIRFHW